MRTLILGLAAAVALGASAVVVSGQHGAGAQHAPATHPASHAMALHACESAAGSEGKASSAHLDMIAEHLNLTSDQRGTVERVSNEACAAMARYHEQILAVLTPEQRETLKKFHGQAESAHEESALHAFMKKLHGR